ncbi:Glutathione transport system permease protein gsiD [Kluyvera cryocrescens]|uniref:Glutathione transport system permease protein gsiD n=1 Tax=Kluyvera cryocrescens TaxID=580 RepID=A0A485BZ19_KLUCR|nr:Glutathione transport system permease protein gsiD [Kluyvera cryocrescens]
MSTWLSPLPWTAWPPIARLARAETLSLRQADFISAVRLQGASPARVLWRHIVPLCLPSVIIRITMNMAGIILTAAGLGFLGLGAQPPEPEWGRDDLQWPYLHDGVLVGGDNSGAGDSYQQLSVSTF